MHQKIVAAGAGREQGSVGRASGQCPGGRRSLGYAKAIGNVSLDGGKQRLDFAKVGVNRHGTAGQRTQAFNDCVPLATHYFVSIAS